MSFARFHFKIKADQLSVAGLLQESCCSGYFLPVTQVCILLLCHTPEIVNNICVVPCQQVLLFRFGKDLKWK